MAQLNGFVKWTTDFLNGQVNEIKPISYLFKAYSFCLPILCLETDIHQIQSLDFILTQKQLQGLVNQESFYRKKHYLHSEAEQ